MIFSKLRRLVGLFIRDCRITYLCKISTNRLQVGKNTKISLGVWLDVSGGIVIGDNCVIARGTAILAHDGAQRWMGRPQHYLQETVIGNNVFIGMNVTVLPGVSIGDEVIVGAGSVVTKNIPSGSIVAGNPATVIRNDYSYCFKE